MRLTRPGTAALAAAALLTGCGGSGPPSYPRSVEKGFLQACGASHKGPQACRCILNKIEDTVPYAEFRLADDALRERRPASAATRKKVAAATNACA